ncbi:hypothetical protein Tco_0821440 [Tanacetum coccineum]|uniref:Uncharacterized protein n=1 Tax=Tanacetum coccineum TaxID=301880 RepID=A0ABQ5AGF8_9ASTR
MLKWGLKWFRIGAEIGMGLGAEMGVEMGAFGHQVRICIRKFCKALEEAAFRPVLHHYDGSKNAGLARSCAEQRCGLYFSRQRPVGIHISNETLRALNGTVTVRPLPIGSSVSGKLLYFEQDNGGGYSIALQDEEALRQTPEEKARAEKELEEKMKQQKAEYELFTLEFLLRQPYQPLFLKSLTVRPLPIGSSVSGKLLYFEQDNGGGYSIALQVHPFIFSLQLFKNLNDMEDQERAANVPGGHVKPALTFGQSAEIPAIKAKLYLPIHESVYDVPRGKPHILSQRCLTTQEETQTESAFIDKTVKICQDNIHSDPGNEKDHLKVTLLRIDPSLQALFLSDNAPFVFLGFGLLCAAFAVKRLATEFEERKHERIRKEIEEREHEEEQDIINEVGKGECDKASFDGVSNAPGS